MKKLFERSSKAKFILILAVMLIIILSVLFVVVNGLANNERKLAFAEEIDNFVVSFDSNGGSSVNDISTNIGTAISPPSDPILNGHTFDGWYIDDALQNPFNFDNLITQNVTLYAKWIINVSSNITRDHGNTGGNNCNAIISEDNETITFNGEIEYYPEDLTLGRIAGNRVGIEIKAPDGFDATNSTVKIGDNTYTGEFDNGGLYWYPLVTEAGQTFTAIVTWNSASVQTFTVIIDENATLQQYNITITFESNGGSPVDPIEQEYGTEIFEPETPILDGFIFNGWYDDMECTTPYYFGTMPAENITLYASWIEDSANEDLFIIRFNSNGGTPVDSIEQEYDTDIFEPDAPTRNGYTFNGWYEDMELTSLYVFNKMPNDIIIIYAGWTANSYTISFDSNGGSEINSITQDCGTPVIDPNAPIKTDYIFVGWFIDDQMTILYTFTSMPAGDITLYANWITELSNPYAITFDSNDGSIVDPIIQDFGTIELEPTTPEKIGYAFGGWFTDQSLTIPYQFNTTKAINMTLYAKWIDNIEYLLIEKENVLEQYELNECFNLINDQQTIIEIMNGMEYENNIPISIAMSDEIEVGISNFSSIEDATNFENYLNAMGQDEEEFQVIRQNEIVCFGYPMILNLLLYDLITLNGINFIVKDDEVEVFQYVGDEEIVSIPNTINGKPVTQIGMNAFCETAITSLDIPESIISIGGGAFSYCQNLTTINFSANNQICYVGDYAFEGTPWYENKLDGLIYIGNVLYKYKGFVTEENSSIVINEGIVSITNYAFEGQTNISSITLPTSLLSLDEESLYLGYKENSYFDNWYIDNGFINPFDYNLSSLDSIIIYPHWNEIDNEFNVYFNNSFGDSYSIELNYGELVPEPTPPTAENYIFIGWYLDYEYTELFWFDTIIGEDINLYAKWEIIKFTATFLDYDERFISEITVDYQTSAVAPENPIRTGYTFTGWDKDFQSMTEDITITATYTINQYTAIFKDYDGTILSVYTADYLTVVIAPEVQIRIGYSFIGWDKDYYSLTMDIEITALYSINQYMLSFHNGYDDTIYYYVDYNSTINYPADPIRIGYTFAGWDNDITIMPAEPVYINATWTINQYTLTFYNGYDANINQNTIEFDSPILAIYYPENPIRTGYTFVGWDTTITNMPAQNTTISAVWTINHYTLIFHNGYNSNINENDVDFDSIIIYPNEPTRTGYTFVGWDNTITNMPAEATIINATWRINQYTAIFKDSDGTIIITSTADYLTSAIAPTVTKTGYSVSWDTDFSSMTEDIEVNIIYTINQYTISFIFNGGTGINSITQDYGTELLQPEAPIKLEGNFVGWYDDIDLTTPYIFCTMPAENINVYAKWIMNQHTITFDSNGGTAVNSVTQDYGSDLIEPFAPLYENYIFVGWFTNTELTDAYCFDKMGYDIVLYARWMQGLELQLINNNTEYQIESCNCQDEYIILPYKYNEKPITSIGSLDYGNSSANTIIIPHSIKSIDINTFRNYLRYLTHISVNENNLRYKSIDGVLFSKDGKDLLCYPENKINTNYTIPSDVTTIGNQAFIGCGLLTEIIIPDGVTSIGEYAFCACTALTDITIPNSINSIYGGAFEYCTRLKNIILPNNNLYFYEIPYCAFSYCCSLTNITIPSSVYRIESAAFEGCTSLTNITLPCNLNTIGASAFEGCTSLTNITLPCNLETIEAAAFKGCSSLSNIIIPSSVTNIGYSIFDNYEYSSRDIDIYYNIYGAFGTFSDCISLTNITIPSNVITMGYFTFSGCTALTGINILGNITSIKAFTFSGCSSLTNITIPSSVTTIGDGAFRGCVSLTNVIIPNNVISMGSSIFRECTLLAYINIFGHITNINDFTFCECSSLTNIIIPSSVTSIGESAFMGCSSLTDITIPSSVTTIGDATFMGCSSLTDITIPSSVTTIGDGAFMGCISLSNVIIPNNVTSMGSSIFRECTTLNGISLLGNITSIGDFTFSECNSLTSITIPSSVTGIGISAFMGCSSLTEITIPSSVTTMGDATFKNCSAISNIIILGNITILKASTFMGCISLTDITIPNSISDIESSTFDGCSTLNSIILPSSLTSICDYTFRGCSDLTSITIPSGVTSIGRYAFKGCSSLIDIVIPSSVVEIGYNAFDECISLTDITIPSSVTIIEKYTFNECSSLTDIVIPNGVVEIGYSAFKDCISLLNITLPNSITIIGSEAFYNCESLLNVTLPDSLTSIGSQAFNYCGSLSSIVIPNSITSIEFCTFGSCSSLTNVVIPNSVTSILWCAFSWCTSLTTINLPDNVDLDWRVFTGCSALTNITIPSSVKMIYRELFRNCTSLESIVIPNSVTDIDLEAFSNCYSLKNITIPTSVESIGESAFEGCSSLTNVTIPNNVTSIGQYAFEKCSSLTNVTIPNNVTSINDGVFNSCTKLKNITISENATSIGESAFCNCTSLESVTIPNNVTNINDYAFYGCSSLTNVTIANNLTAIGSYAFYDCSSLASIIINAITPPSLGVNDVFGCLPLYSKIYVPAGSENDYKSSAYWTEYASLIEDIGNSEQYIIENGFVWSSDRTVLLMANKNIEGEYIIPNLVTSIGNSAFSDCTKLTSIILSNSITSIEDDVFNNCVNLRKVYINDLNSWCNINFANSVSNPLFYAKNLYINNVLAKTIIIPDNITNIGNYLFINCSSLTNITISNSVTSIGDFAFKNCNYLKIINIEVNTNNTIISGGNEMFSSDSLKIYVDPNSLIQYKEANYWNNYASKIYALLKVTFNTYGGVNLDPKFVYAGTLTQDLPETTRSGYTFENWYTNEYLPNNRILTNIQVNANWRANINTLCFNSNSGIGTMNDMEIATDDVEYLLPNNFTKEGYIFAGWSTTQDGEIEYCDRDIYEMGTDSNYTLYAKWLPNINTLTFNSNSGVGTMQTMQISTDSNVNLLTNAYVKVGYSFIGWSTIQNGEVEYMDCANYTMGTESNYILYAQWTANINLLTFNANTGCGTMDNMEIATDSNVNLLPVTYNKAGYTFIGWSTMADGEVEYVDCANYTMGTGTNYILYAKWIANINLLCFDSNSGIGTMNNMEIASDESIYLIPNTFTKEGYEFGGWSTTANGEIDYLNEANYTMGTNANYILYARWSTTLCFNSNTGNGTMDSMEILVDLSINIIPNIFVKVGYTFAGWSTMADGEVEYGDCANYSLGTETNIILYAKWIANINILYFDSNSGIGTMNNMEIATDASINLTPNTFTKDGFNFEGWSTTENGEIVYLNEANYTMGTNSNYILYARWSTTLSFNSNTGNGTMDSMEGIVDLSIILEPNTFSKEGYIFAGWSTMADGEVEYIDCSVYIMENVANNVLYAVWTGNVYTVIYDSNKPEIAAGKIEGITLDSIHTYDVASELEVNDYSLEGYTFCGWSTIKNGVAEYSNCQNVLNLTVINNATIRLYAVWIGNIYTVIYNSNKPAIASAIIEGTTSNSNCTYDVASNLNENGYSLLGWTFIGWSTIQNNVVKLEEVLNLTSINNATVILYAIWKANTYQISYDNNKPLQTNNPVEGITENSNHTYDVASNLNKEGYKLLGWDFGGWSTTTNGEVEFTDSQSISNLTFTNNGTVTLYAVWTETPIYNGQSMYITPESLHGFSVNSSLSTDDPVMTILTHGVGGDASHWSNKYGGLCYFKESIIEKLRANSPDSIVAIAEMNIDPELKFTLKPLEIPSYENEEYIIGSPITEITLNDLSKHFIILFQSYNSMQNNESEYTALNYLIDKLTYDFYYLGVENPTINLIGHSRGGIVNMMYAIDHPFNVDSIYSIGTPYNSSNLLQLGIQIGSISDEYGLDEGAFGDLADLDMLAVMKNEWNNTIQNINSSIKAYAVGTAFDADFLKNFGYKIDNAIGAIWGIYNFYKNNNIDAFISTLPMVEELLLFFTPDADNAKYMLKLLNIINEINKCTNLYEVINIVYANKDLIANGDTEVSNAIIAIKLLLAYLATRYALGEDISDDLEGTPLKKWTAQEIFGENDTPIVGNSKFIPLLDELNLDIDKYISQLNGFVIEDFFNANGINIDKLLNYLITSEDLEKIKTMKWSELLCVDLGQSIIFKGLVEFVSEHPYFTAGIINTAQFITMFAEWLYERAEWIYEKHGNEPYDFYIGYIEFKEGIQSVLNAIAEEIKLKSSTMFSSSIFDFFKFKQNKIVFLGDIFVGLSSQLAEGYEGFNTYAKLLSDDNTDIYNVSNGQIPVPIPHNLETQDNDIIKFIMDNIALGGTQSSDYVVKILGNNNIGIIGYKGNQTELNIPSEIYGKVVSEISENAFEGGNFISIILPNTIEYIGDYAFSNNTLLTNITLSLNLKYIGYAAFYNCISLSNIDILESVEIIEEDAFAFCDNLAVQVNADNDNYFSVNGILFNKDATILVKFSGNSIVNYNIPSTVEEISKFAFANKTNLVSVNLNNVKKIGQGAFYNNSNLAIISGGNNLANAGLNAFEGSAWLNNNLGDTNGMVILGKALIKYKGISNVISNCMFPSNITTIGEGAFKDTNITEISISENIDYIQNNAFIGCTDLQSITIRKFYPPIMGVNVFLGISSNGKIYVPVSNFEYYQNSIFLSEYKNILYTKQVNVEFEANGGTAVDAFTELFYSFIENFPVSTKQYYDFEGWYDNAECTGAKIQNGEYWLYDTDLTLYANWVPTTYGISYIYNGGIYVDNKLDYNCESNLDINATSKTGYTFDAWYENSDFTGTGITNTSQFEVFENKTLYAKFNPNTYVVDLNKIAENAILLIDEISVIFGDSYILPIPEREGYDFEGWYTITEERYSTETGDSVKNWDIDSDTILNAKWRAESYIIIINNGEVTKFLSKDGISDDQETTLNYNDTFDLDQFFESIRQSQYGSFWFKEGHQIETISLKNNNGETIYWTDNIVPDLGSTDVELNLEVLWKKEEHTIKFIALEEDPQTIEAEFGELLSINTPPIKIGYIFDRWVFTASIGGDFDYPVGAIFDYSRMPDLTTHYMGSGGEITVTAIYEAKPCTIIFNTDGGSTVPSITATYDQVLPEINSTKPGYTLSHYYCGENDRNYIFGETVWDIDKTGVVDLTANWTPNEYQIIYDLDGGVANENPEIYVTGQHFTLNPATKTGYKFKHWENTVNKKTVPGITATTFGDIYLKAIYIGEVIYANSVTSIINEVAILDFSKLSNGCNLFRVFTIKPEVRQITLKGGGNFINNISFKIADRKNELTIILWDMRFKAFFEISAIYFASESEKKVYINCFGNNEIYGASITTNNNINAAIKIKNIDIVGIGGNDKLSIYGGNGLGENGIYGGTGIYTKNIYMENIDLLIYGGDGGKGRDADGNDNIGTPGEDESSATGGDGPKGYIGGSGGNGGIALMCEQATNNGGTVEVYGGNGGAGGKGGKGGKGGTGGTGDNGYPCHYGTDGGKGGKGGTGGTGGTGGNGGISLEGEDVNKNIFIEAGKSGIQGIRGDGGDGGDGGQGGKKHISWIFGYHNVGAEGDPGDPGEGTVEEPN